MLTGKVYGPGDAIEIPALGGVILVPAEQAVEIVVDYEGLAPAWEWEPSARHSSLTRRESLLK